MKQQQHSGVKAQAPARRPAPHQAAPDLERIRRELGWGLQTPARA
ncbi:MAG: hypothetical protein V4582_05655 [Pseudomonadota bacterium]